MEADLLVRLGKIAGIAGISLGVLLLVFRDVVRKNVFSKLTPRQSYGLLRLIVVLTFLIGLAGMTAWLRGPRDAVDTLRATSLFIPAAIAGQPTAAEITIENIGRNRVFDEFKHELFVNGELVQQFVLPLDVKPQLTTIFGTRLLFDSAGSHNVVYVLSRALTRLASVQAIARVSRPAEIAAPAAVATPFSGRWFIKFHFEHNTSKPDEPPRPWVDFVADLVQTGSRVTGTLTSGYTNGELEAISEGGELRGRIKLGWDNDWWESFRMTLQTDSSVALGRALVTFPNTGETHQYTVFAQRTSS